jgi:hypothetical protein
MWGNESYMVLKIDMSKAYDCVELVFLAEVMKQLGFTSKWIDLIMKCITFVRYAAVVNEQPVGHICPTKGIQQGDPLSPYLFFLRAEALSSQLQQYEQIRQLKGVPTFIGEPRLNHLFFAS